MTVGDWVRRLAAPAGAGLAPVCFPETIATAEAQIGPGAVNWAVHVSRDLALGLVDQLPQLTGSAHDVHLLRMATEPVVIATLLGVHAGQVDAGTVSAEIRFVIREYVRRHVPMDVMGASIVRGHGWLSERLIVACQQLLPPGAHGPELELVSRVLFGSLNPLGLSSQEVYEQEQRQWSQSAGQATDLLVRAVLAGERSDAAIAADLRYSIEHRRHVGLILWRERMAPPGTMTDLTELATGLLADLGATSHLLLPVGSLEVWAWGSRLDAFDATCLLAPAQLTHSHVKVAVGSAGTGLAGFRTTHQQAHRAARVSRLPGAGSGPVTAFRDVNLVSLLSGDVQQAREFVNDELGELAAEGQPWRDLRETALAYLECHRSPQQAAQLLFVARNTVSYRVKRAEAVLGHSLTERESEVRAALLLARLLG